jgi:hypothetical protein
MAGGLGAPGSAYPAPLLSAMHCSHRRPRSPPAALQQSGGAGGTQRRGDCRIRQESRPRGSFGSHRAVPRASRYAHLSRRQPVSLPSTSPRKHGKPRGRRLLKHPAGHPPRRLVQGRRKPPQGTRPGPEAGRKGGAAAAQLPDHPAVGRRCHRVVGPIARHRQDAHGTRGPRLACRARPGRRRWPPTRRAGELGCARAVHVVRRGSVARRQGPLCPDYRWRQRGAVSPRPVALCTAPRTSCPSIRHSSPTVTFLFQHPSASHVFPPLPPHPNPNPGRRPRTPSMDSSFQQPPHKRSRGESDDRPRRYPDAASVLTIVISSSPLIDFSHRHIQHIRRAMTSIDSVGSHG